MARKRINIYELTHQYVDDKNIFLKTDIPEKDLVNLIHGWQKVACDLEETFDLEPEEMRGVLCFDDRIKSYPNYSDEKEIEEAQNGFDCITLDLYNIWEAADITVEDSELLKEPFTNERYVKAIKNFIIDSK